MIIKQTILIAWKPWGPRKEKFSFTSHGFQGNINVDIKILYIKQFDVALNIYLRIEKNVWWCRVKLP